MAGRITNSEKQLRPDPRYNDKTLAKFINCIMYSGKKVTAQQIVYDALDIMTERVAKAKERPEDFPTEPLAIFLAAIDNVKPNVEVRSKRVGGANYQVPMQVSQKRRQSLGFRWLINAARSERGKPMAERLAKELFDAARGEGKAMNTREQTHRMAEANKAFAHFAW